MELLMNYNKVNVHKQYWALKKINDDRYEIVASYYDLNRLIAKGYKYFYDAIEHEMYEVTEEENDR